MRPKALDRIERGLRSTKKPAARVQKRGPKNRPTYRLWEHATWRVRMRAWCNHIKKRLLNGSCDVARPQTYKVIQSGQSPVDNASTWLRWWEGDAVPQPSHVREVERLAPGSSRLLDLSEVSTPELRHLLALDIVNTRFRTAGRPSDFQRTQSEHLLTALNNAWRPFLDSRPVPATNQFALEAQIGVDAAKLRHPVMATAADVEWIQSGGNLLRLAVPRVAKMEHNWLEPISIFRFLGSLGTFAELENDALLRMWAYDYASAAMVLRTRIQLTADEDMPVIRMGRAGIMYSIATYTFWAPDLAKLEPMLLRFIQLLAPDEVDLVRKRLLAARAAYSSGLADWGIPASAIKALSSDHRSKTWDEAFSFARGRL